MRVLLVIVVIIGMVALVGCGGKKARPVEEQQDVTEEGARKPGEEEEPGEEGGIKPIQPAETEELEFRSIHFDYDKYNLTSTATAVLAENASLLMENPNVRVLIEGHCDERGTTEYNLALGEKRALAARDYLVNFGIAKSRLSVISYGEERPVDPAGTDAAWAKNRRAEFVEK